MTQESNSSFPKGIYIHFPFCLKKCSYCDFYSIPGVSASIRDQYTQALLHEIDRQAAVTCSSNPIQSIYFGGGTPSLLSSGQIARVLERVNARFQVDAGAEITLEANPATLDRDKLVGMLEAGINRISLGVQSFNDNELQMLGRVHNSSDVFKTIDIIKSLPLKNYNIDLIYGLPGQSIEGWLGNLQQLMSCHPRHISMYLLQLDPVTPMGQEVDSKRMLLPDDDSVADMYYAGIDYLTGKGYRQYEISNLSLPGAECRHNIFYWQAESYLGLGAGAVSYGKGRRWRNLPDINAYLNCCQSQETCPIEELEHMDEQGIISDAVILGLRMTDGIDLERFSQRFGIDLASYYKEVIKLCRAQGLLEMEQGRLFLTKTGYFLSNQVLCRFMA